MNKSIKINHSENSKEKSAAPVPDKVTFNKNLNDKISNENTEKQTNVNNNDEIDEEIYQVVHSKSSDKLQKQKTPKGNRLEHLELSHLPKLPLPTLEQTFSRYLQTVKPLFLNEEENKLEAFQKTKKLVYEFVYGSKKEGMILDTELRNLSNQNPTGFLEGFWNTMYLENRDTILINTSPYFMLRPDPNRTHPCARAANFLRGTVAFANMIINNEFPDEIKYEISHINGNVIKTELCLTQYNWVLSSRIASPGRDYLKSTLRSKHAVVLCRHQFYKVQLYESDEILRSEESIFNELNQIVLDARKIQKHLILPVGCLTTSDRDTWAQARKQLEQDPVSKVSLSTIDEALILIILDETSPTHWDDIARLGIHSDGRNVWLDKSLAITICQNGATAITMEHSGFDGDTFLGWARFVTEYAEKTKPINTTVELMKMNVNKLKWNLTKSIIKTIKNSETNVDDFIDTLDLTVLRFSDFGKDEIKKIGVSPDAFVQLAFQLAYFKLFRKTISTYEPMNAKRFYHGRTTTVRVQTKESRLFTHSFCDPLTTIHEKAETLRKASLTHQQNINRSKNGQGIDRHLFGLYWIAKHNTQKIPGYSIPKIFLDESYIMLKKDLMSTSNTSGVPGITIQGFGPVTPEGFGLGYIYDNNSITISITSFRKKSTMFRDVLKYSLIDMKRVLEADLKNQSSSSKI